MRLICPSCGAIHSGEAWADDVYARKALAVVAGLPREVAPHAVPYVALFRAPDAVRGLQWRRAEKLLTELAALVRAGHVSRKGRPDRAAPPAVWGRALAQILDRPPRRLPLTGHGYLGTVVWDQADQADARAEYAYNRAERAGTAVQREATVSQPEKLSLDELRAIKEKNLQKRRKP